MDGSDANRIIVVGGGLAGLFPHGWLSPPDLRSRFWRRRRYAGEGSDLRPQDIYQDGLSTWAANWLAKRTL